MNVRIRNVAKRALNHMELIMYSEEARESHSYLSSKPAKGGPTGPFLRQGPFCYIQDPQS